MHVHIKVHFEEISEVTMHIHIKVHFEEISEVMMHVHIKACILKKFQR